MIKTRLVAGIILAATILSGVSALYCGEVKTSQNEKVVLMDDLRIVKDANATSVLKSANQLDVLTESSALKNNDTNSKVVDKKKAKTTEKNSKKKKAKEDYKDLGTFKVTAYCGCSTCCGKSNGMTASGTKATAGRTIAADTSKYPFGSELIIDGHTYTVEDRGGAINGNRIDIYFNSHSEALQWGVRYCNVYTK